MGGRLDLNSARFLDTVKFAIEQASKVHVPSRRELPNFPAETGQSKYVPYRRGASTRLAFNPAGSNLNVEGLALPATDFKRTAAVMSELQRRVEAAASNGVTEENEQSEQRPITNAEFAKLGRWAWAQGVTSRHLPELREALKTLGLDATYGTDIEGRPATTPLNPLTAIDAAYVVNELFELFKAVEEYEGTGARCEVFTHFKTAVDALSPQARYLLSVIDRDVNTGKLKQTDPRARFISAGCWL